jgi:hypothetical protein
VRDRIVVDEAAQSGRLYREVERLDPAAPLREVVGRWAHTAELDAKLPVALRWLGLLPTRNHRSPVRGVV